MRYYESIFILHPQTEEAEIDRLQASFTETVSGQGGEVFMSKRWGLRSLAYEVQKQSQGFYILLYVQGEPGVITELERQYKINEPVIKFQTVRLDEKRLAALAEEAAKEEAAREQAAKDEAARAKAEAEKPAEEAPPAEPPESTPAPETPAEPAVVEDEPPAKEE